MVALVTGAASGIEGMRGKRYYNTTKDASEKDIG
jgi:hypothetical protein